MHTISYLTLLLSPFFSGILMILIMIPISFLQILGVNRIFISYISSLMSGILLIFFYSIFFNWIKVDFGIIPFFIIIISIFYNNLKRVRNKPNIEFEKVIGILEISGVIVGSSIWIFNLIKL